MSGIEVALGTHFIDNLAGIVLAGITRHRPKNQTKSGDDYLDRALILTEEHRAILNETDREAIENEYEAARTLKDILEIQGGLKALEISHRYKRQAKQTYIVAKKLSTLRRLAKVFAKDVADAVVDIAERDTESPNLTPATKDDLRLKIVNSIESSPEGRLYSHENTSSADIAEVARKVWAMMKVENMVFFRAT